MPDRGSDSLDRREQQILRELEADLRSEEPELARLLERPFGLGRLRYAMGADDSARWWLVVALGVVLFVVGLIAAFVPSAFVGFVVVVVGTDRLVDNRSIRQMFAASVSRLRHMLTDGSP